MSTDTRLLPNKQPRATGIAQTQFVNRPATMGSSGAPPVSASPAASKATQQQAVNANAQRGTARGRDANVVLMDRQTAQRQGGRTAMPGTNGGNMQRGTRIPGPPGSAVQSVELLPNVTKGAQRVEPARPAPPMLSIDEMLLATHLLEEFAGKSENAPHKDLADGALQKLAGLLASQSAQG